MVVSTAMPTIVADLSCLGCLAWIAVGILFVVGAVTLGAGLWLPLFQQTVLGASAADSGLLMLPMVLPVLIASTVAGKIMSAAGRYQISPIADAAFTTAGMGLPATVGADTPRLLTSCCKRSSALAWSSACRYRARSPRIPSKCATSAPPAAPSASSADRRRNRRRRLQRPVNHALNSNAPHPARAGRVRHRRPTPDFGHAWPPPFTHPLSSSPTPIACPYASMRRPSPGTSTPSSPPRPPMTTQAVRGMRTSA